VSDCSFGLRLRAERERRRITLESIAANTKISIGLLRALERDDVSRWPGGIFRRSFVRAYAEAIGLDADETVAEFTQQFPDAEALRAAAAAPPPGQKTAPEGGLRLTLADNRGPFAGGAVLSRVRERGAAAALDVGLMLALALVIFIIIGEFWAPLGITMLCYYVVSIMSLGNTPGVCLFAPRPADEPVTVDEEVPGAADESRFADGT
jgi:transcriptional regulator with XRE-family HTH domain